MTDQNEASIALQEAYANIYNELVKPDRVFVATQYFRKKWLPLLGPTLAWVIISLRQHCYWSKETGHKRDWCLISQAELAAEVGISVATLKRLLKQEHADQFIIDISHRYRYDRQKRKQVRKNSMYRIRMDDPLTPDDAVRLKELLVDKMSGLDADPETGQIDFLQLLDQLSKTSIDDLQLKLSSRSDEKELIVDQTKTRRSDGELVGRVSQLLTGSPEPAGPRHAAASANMPAYPNAVHIPANALLGYQLAEDQVLICSNGDFLAVPMIEVVKRDLRLSGGHPSARSRTECFYSVQDARGEGPDDWLPEEQARIDQMSHLERELSQNYQKLGAFSLEEALHEYFSPELATEFLQTARDSPAELERIQAWVIYTRKARGLNNPSGFLRTRLESGELPPSNQGNLYGSN